jgi:hypothetical protein
MVLINESHHWMLGGENPATTVLVEVIQVSE